MFCDNLFNQYVTRAKNIRKTREKLISIYRYQNIYSRMVDDQDAKEPASFKTDPKIGIGIFAGNLDEDCV